MIEQNFKVAISYNLFADNVLVESKTEENPMSFITGVSPVFDQIVNDIKSKNVGDKFNIEFHADEMLPPYEEAAIVILEKDHFVNDNTSMEEINEIFTIGSQVPMTASDGQMVLGTVKSTDDKTVTMDFNHPLAGKQLKFEGTIVSAVEATEQEILEEHLANASFNEIMNDDQDECQCEDCQCETKE